ncbi:DUF4386 domain-containing protein [Demequina sp. SO4-13]|uniref:DUF4386 domain-containing protein n=1 Tax=Demequina sp. SO4-13 TaxID=3401027 RepID=UPI003AF78BC6
MISSVSLSPSKAARWAGVGYLVLFVLAIAANFGVRSQLVVDDDPATTMANIATNETTFRLGLAAFVAIAMIDLLIAWALHVTLRRTGEHRSLLAAWLRFGYSVILGASLTFTALALEIATAGDRQAGLTLAQRESFTMLALHGFEIGWLIALVAFGLHLIVLARILFASRIAPRALSVALGAAGAAYIVDTFAHAALPDYSAIASIMLVVVAVPSMVAELWFAGWLLARAPRAVATVPDRELAAAVV